MRNRLIIFLASMLSAVTALASGIDYIDQGNKAYEQKQYKKAVEAIVGVAQVVTKL